MKLAYITSLLIAATAVAAAPTPSPEPIRPILYRIVVNAYAAENATAEESLAHLKRAFLNDEVELISEGIEKRDAEAPKTDAAVANLLGFYFRDWAAKRDEESVKSTAAVANLLGFYIRDWSAK